MLFLPFNQNSPLGQKIVTHLRMFLDGREGLKRDLAVFGGMIEGDRSQDSQYARPVTEVGYADLATAHLSFLELNALYFILSSNGFKFQDGSPT